MKTDIFSFAALSLLQLAAAQPHRQRHHHHQHVHRDVTTEVDIVTAYAPEAVVFVDQDGKPFSTSFGYQPHPTPAPAPVSSSSPASVAAPAPSSTPPAYNQPPPPPASSAPPSSAGSSAPPAPVQSAPASSKKAPPPPPTSAKSSPAQSSAPASSSGPSNSGYGISYSPYNSDSSCKTADQVKQDFAKISGYSLVRIYGTDCNQVSSVLAAAKAKGMKVFAGVFDISNVANEVNTIISAAKNDWSSIDTISIGNELVNNGAASVSQVTSAVGAARSQLRGAGYTGPVVTVDTFVAMIANPALCKASDYAAANCHAYFDGGIDASSAGSFVASQYNLVSAACGGMHTVITESGWPSAGNANGKAAPGTANQQAAVSSLKSAFTGSKAGNMILFSAFNDLWKAPGSEGVEQSWGILGNA